ncbi:hypothetical protein M1523_02550 [Patescibacteria group bacterium]|nr:hypothetical protein [Patescibacteria group bacterium]MCL5091399.1 hypothetical protein [Patescibacteria group bacterium]
MNNFTPLDLTRFQERPAAAPVKEGGNNVVLLVIATITAAVLAVMLFLLIQNKLRQSTTNAVPAIVTPAPVSPTEMPTAIPMPITSPSATGEASTAPGLVTTIVPPLATVTPASASPTLAPSVTP